MDVSPLPWSRPPPSRPAQQGQHDQQWQQDAPAASSTRRPCRPARPPWAQARRPAAAGARFSSGPVERVRREPGADRRDERRLHLAQRHLERVDVLPERSLEQRGRKAQDDLVHLEVVVPDGHPDRHVQRHRWQRQVELDGLVPQHQLRRASTATRLVPHRVDLGADLLLRRPGCVVDLGAEGRLGLGGDVADPCLLDDEAEPDVPRTGDSKVSPGKRSRASRSIVCTSSGPRQAQGMFSAVTVVVCPTDAARASASPARSASSSRVAGLSWSTGSRSAASAAEGADASARLSMFFAPPCEGVLLRTPRAKGPRGQGDVGPRGTQRTSRRGVTDGADGPDGRQNLCRSPRIAAGSRLRLRCGAEVELRHHPVSDRSALERRLPAVAAGLAARRR